MEWNRVSWTRSLHGIRTALIEQDGLSGCGQAVPGDGQREPEREHRPWAARAPRGFGSWAMLYHQGRPVAVCPVAAVSGDTMQVGCGPLWFERDAPLVLQFTSHSEPGRIGTRMMGAVEGFDEFGMRVRLAPTRG